MAQVINSYIALPTHYDMLGMYVNGETSNIADGILVVLGSDGKSLKLPAAADTASHLKCMEIGHIFDKTPAIRFHVESLSKEYFVGEHSDDTYYNLLEYDTTKSETKPGKYMRVHALHVGEEFWVAYDVLPTTFVVGNNYGVLATGEIG